ncbi:MAG TPA: peptidoglycan recognition family protein [Longimicrobiaceae bacterium]|nr:peptidoglycan recognition family protein [Longimicrobiaceae bacterium]
MRLSAPLLCLALLAPAGCAPRPVPAVPPRPAPAAEPPAVPAPPIVPRAAWGAQPPVAPMQRHAIRRITIHHTASLQRPDRTLQDKLRGLQRFSQTESPLADGRTKPPWPDIPYHYYVDLEGRIAEAREVEYAGDSNTAYDPTGHLLIVLEGNFEIEYPTAPQMESLRRLVRWASLRWGVPAEGIGKHNDFADTACPGDHLEVQLPRLRELAGG